LTKEENDKFIEDDLNNSSNLKIMTNWYKKVTSQDTIHLANNLVIK
ncbi:23864_t:CDS:1, partial [Cetraspora pellucida]